MNLDRDQLAQTLRSVALPALAGAAGGGALGAYASAQADPRGELPAQRRRRILRNALIAASLGGTAGATIPMGVGMLAKPYFGNGATGGPGLMDQAISGGMSSLLPLGAGVGGAIGIKRIHDAQRNRALGYVVENLKKHPVPRARAPSIPDLSSPAQLMHLMNQNDPRVTKHLLATLMGRNVSLENPDNLFKAVDVLHEAGHPTLKLNDLQGMFGQGLKDRGILSGAGRPVAGQAAEAAPALREAFMKYVGKSFNPIRYLLGQTQNAGRIPGVSAPVAESIGRGGASLAELYMRMARPGANSVVGRMFGPAGKLALLGGGVFGANKLQQHLMGN